MRISKAVMLADGRTARGRFDRLTITLHWAIALLVVAQLASGWALGEFGAGLAVPNLLFYHRSVGALIWSLALLRFVWRHTWATFPPFPSNMWRIAKWSALASEYGFYLLLFVQPLSGLALTMLRGRPFALFDLTVPIILPRNLALSERIGELHVLGSLAFVGLVGVHAAAALMHHYILRDDVLELMAPLLRRDNRRHDLREQVLALRS